VCGLVLASGPFRASAQATNAPAAAAQPPPLLPPPRSGSRGTGASQTTTISVSPIWTYVNTARLAAISHPPCRRI